jgi:hypothetical protein
MHPVQALLFCEVQIHGVGAEEKVVAQSAALACLKSWLNAVSPTTSRVSRCVCVAMSVRKLLLPPSQLLLARCCCQISASRADLHIAA